MPVRIVEGQLPYTGGTGIEIDANKVISLLLREENNLILVNDDNEIYTDLQLASGLTPQSDFPVGVTTGKVLEGDGRPQSGLMLNWKTTSGDYARWIYCADGEIYFDGGSGTRNQVYYSSEVDALLQQLRTYVDTNYQPKLTAGAGITIDQNNVISAQGAGTGDVLGPSSSVNGHLAVFDGTTGKAIKDGGPIPTAPTYTAGAGINIDGNNEISNTIPGATVSASAPSSPIEGMQWYDTTNDVLKVYNGSSWESIATGGAISDTAYGSSWDGETTTAPSQNAVYDKISSMDSTLSGLGTASTKDVGTSSGEVPVLDSNGHLATSTLPGVALTDTFTVSTSSDLTSLSSADQGDIAIVTSENKTYVLSVAPYSTASNWKEILAPTGGVTSFNGQTGAVTYTAPVSSVNNQTGAVTVLESQTKVFTMPEVGDSVSDILTWLGAGKVAILKDGNIFYQIVAYNTIYGWIAYSYIQPANNITTTDSLKCYTIYYDTTTLEIDTKDDRDYILVPTGGSNGQVLTATSSTAVAWQTPSGGDVVVSSQPNNILTSGMKIRAGTETNYGNLGTYDSNCLYLVIE